MANDVAIAGCNSIAIGQNGEMAFRQFGEIIAFSELCEKAGILPKNTSKEQAAIAIVFGAQMGLPALAAIQNVAVINGRPSVWGDAIGALVQPMIDDEYEEQVGEKETFAIRYHVKRRGRSREIVREFGYKDAKSAGLWGKAGPWTQYPTRMMMIRARAFAYRDAFPDLLKGIRIAEEEQDQPIDVTDQVTVGDPAYGGKEKPARQITAADIVSAKGAPRAASEKPKAKVPEAAPSNGGDPASLFPKV